MRTTLHRRSLRPITVDNGDGPPRAVSGLHDERLLPLARLPDHNGRESTPRFAL